jgi:hypothetical protein
MVNDHIDKVDVKSLLKDTLGNVATKLIAAKEQGSSMPPALDKIASALVKGKQQGIDIAKDMAKDKLKQYIPWAIAAVAGITLIVVVAKRK